MVEDTTATVIANVGLTTDQEDLPVIRQILFLLVKVFLKKYL